MNTDNLKLVYVKPLGVNSSKLYEYDFIFSDVPENVWGVDWGQPRPSLCKNMDPDPSTYSKVRHLKTNIPFITAQENNCLSMEYAVEGIIALCYEDISQYEEYPQEGRLIFKFGDSYQDVEDTLAKRHQLFSDF